MYPFSSAKKLKESSVFAACLTAFNKLMAAIADHFQPTRPYPRGRGQQFHR